MKNSRFKSAQNAIVKSTLSLEAFVLKYFDNVEVGRLTLKTIPVQNKIIR